MKKILGFLKPLKGYAVIAVFLTVLTQLSALLLPYLMSGIVNNGVTKGDMAYIKNFGVIMIAAAAAGLGVSVLNSYYTSKLSALYGRELRRRVFLKVESLSQCDIDKIGTDSLITRSTNDIKQVQDFVLIGLRMILAAPIMLAGGTVMAFIMNARLAVYIFAVIPVIALIVVLLIRFIMPMFRRRQKLTDRLNRLIREQLSGMRVIRAFNKSGDERKKFDESNLELADIALKIARIFAGLIPLCIVLALLSVCALIWVAAKNIDIMTDLNAVADTIGDLQAFMVYMIMIVAALTMSASMFIIVPRANISAKRICEILELEPEIAEPEKPVMAGESGGVEFRDVSFAYPGAKENTLESVSFVAPAGKTTAVIGGTGSGKSSLINLITRFYDVTGGAVLVNGVDVREMRSEKLCSLVGLVPQTASLFSGSIADNIRYGKEDATDAEVLEALKIACADDFVLKLPDGINSRVSQAGSNYSGGQKQRLAIARAIVRKAQIYIFDDSFSALDFRTDARVRSAVAENLKNSAVLIVAQRVGTILGADNIIVLDGGKIAGQGRHSELLETCAVYREIVESQLSAEDIKKGVGENG